MSDHKTNQAMLPPDPGGLNRALDRAAAEHLREVAPHLAPCPSCQAGICAEHGPTVTATTTGERDGILSEPRLLLAVPMPPAPPQPEPVNAPVPAAGEMSREAPPAIVASVYRTFRDMLSEIDSKVEWMRGSIAEVEEEYAKVRASRDEARRETERAVGEGVAALRQRDEAREQRDAEVTAHRRTFAQLPEGMRHCTILFRECEKGHGRLVGANWTDSGCPWCLLAAANARAEEKTRAHDTERAARLKAEGKRDEAERGRVAVAAAFRRVRGSPPSTPPRRANGGE